MSKVQKDIVFLLTIGLLTQIFIYLMNILIHDNLNGSDASDLFFSISFINLISNFFLLGGNSVLMRNIPIIKKKVKNFYLANSFNIFIYFLKLYLLLFLCAQLFEFIFFTFNKHHYKFFMNSIYNHPEIFILGVTLTALTTYVNSFLRAFNKTIIMHYINCITVFLCIVILYYFSKYKLFLPFDKLKNISLIINFLYLYLLDYAIIIPASLIYIKLKIFKIIPKNKDGHIEFSEWKEQITHYYFFGIHSSITFFFLIILKVFSNDHTSISKYSYIFGAIYIIHFLNKLLIPFFQDYINKLIINNNFNSLKKFLFNSIIQLSIAILLYLSYYLLNFKHFITQFELTTYKDYALILSITWTLRCMYGPVISSFLMTYSKTSIKYFSFFNNIFLLITLITSAIYSKIYGLKGMLTTIILYSSFWLIITSIMFIIFLAQYKKERNYHS